MPKVLERAIVIDNVSITDDVKKLVLSSPKTAAQARPGQFINLKAGGSFDPLLRRPLSIAEANSVEGTMGIYYRVVGRGTELMAQLKHGDIVDSVGPLGQGFSLNCKRPLLIGGGMGIAPLIFLTQELCSRPIEVVLAGRTKHELFWQDCFIQSCQAVHITTNDGSLGFKGNALAVLPDLLSKKFDMIYVCGPKPMMKGVAELAIRAGIPCQVSLEEHMACGIGACLSCTCAAGDGTRKKICTDGPVFWAKEVAW